MEKSSSRCKTEGCFNKARYWKFTTGSEEGWQEGTKAVA